MRVTLTRVGQTLPNHSLEPVNDDRVCTRMPKLELRTSMLLLMGLTSTSPGLWTGTSIITARECKVMRQILQWTMIMDIVVLYSMIGNCGCT